MVMTQLSDLSLPQIKKQNTGLFQGEGFFVPWSHMRIPLLLPQ